MENVNELTERQIKILKAIIDEYINNGNAVGSEFLEKKFKLGFSPATIRNDMVVLGKLGYIEKAHFSSGRIPTPKAFRFYLQTLLPKKQLSTAEEASLKNEVWDYQDNTIRFLEESARVLAKKSGLLSLVFLDNGFRYYTGVNNLLAIREFLDFEFSRQVFNYMDDISFWTKALNELLTHHVDFQVLIGEDYLYKSLFNLGAVFAQFNSIGTTGAIGIIGPCRLEYSMALPLVNYSANIIQEVLTKQDEKTK
jgi:heat-inducible transcriptional repressor